MMKKKRKMGKKKTREAAAEVEDAAGGDGQPGETSRGRPARVDYTEFVRTWTGADTVAEVAEAFGIKPTSTIAIASRLRTKGIPLKMFPRRSGQAIDVKALTRIAKGGD